MPVVRIEALPQPDEARVEAALAAVTADLSALLGEDPRGTWATWQPLQPGRYLEGPDGPDVQPRDTHPPVVTVVAAAGRAPELVRRMLTCVADAIAGALALQPGNVFVVYQEVAPGRLYTGDAAGAEEPL